ncbi:MAG: DUF177 domain-containing protein [Betaproteobacteria bacterium]|nr:DUF177 domain-containing protein [Betaproteobacteria bacterium]
MSTHVIDSLEFARTGQELQDKVRVAQLTRLVDSLFDAAGNLRFTLCGGYDAERRPRLNLRVEGEINLRCQRCLGSLAYQVASESSLLVLTGKAGGETARIDDLDGIPANPQTDVQALVEDEVLLALPIAPRHPEGECNAAAKTTQDGAASPFAVLAKLKRQ